jgi:glycosyltransferase involved in cell wall biosynthesis
MPPALSVVVLTWNEARNIGPALRALARQRERDFEVIVVDAASTDGTVPLIEAERPNLPMPLRLVVADTRIPIGEARNRGAALAHAPAVAFVSADAELDERWTEEALRSLRTADVVFSRQVHAPHEWTVGACVRGLRYHFSLHSDQDPLLFASNVAAVYRREVLQRSPFDPWANAAEDLLLAQHAAAAGFRIDYNPWMVVQHHDVPDAKVEWRKNVREGHGWALYARDIGHLRSLLAWGALLLAVLDRGRPVPPWGLGRCRSTCGRPVASRRAPRLAASRRHAAPGLVERRGVQSAVRPRLPRQLRAGVAGPSPVRFPHFIRCRRPQRP